MEIGKVNTLRLDRITSSGAFLEDEQGNDVLLPGKYLTTDMQEESIVDVFIYRDSEDRIVATTEMPLIQLNGFAYLEVKDITLYGAFVDWGLEKDLLVPYKEQKNRLEEGRFYLISLRLDKATDRLYGTTKTDKLLEKCPEAAYNEGDEVDLLICNRTELGQKVVVDDKYQGLIFNSFLDKKIRPGQKLRGYIHSLRSDGKIDVRLSRIGNDRRLDASEELLELLQSKGKLPLGDKSDPELIRDVVGMSKKTFKQAVGKLYKERLIDVSPEEIRLKTK